MKLKHKIVIEILLVIAAIAVFIYNFSMQREIAYIASIVAVCGTNDPEEAFIQKELSQKALLCLHELEEPYKEVFMLSVFGGFSLKDISLTFGKSESWARVTFYRAKQKLSESMR